MFLVDLESDFFPQAGKKPHKTSSSGGGNVFLLAFPFYRTFVDYAAEGISEHGPKEPRESGAPSLHHSPVSIPKISLTL
jgi:hypothetical protein